MKSKPTKNQAAVMALVAAEMGRTNTTVPRSAIARDSGVLARHLTQTIASCIDRGWLVVPTQGFAVYAITEAGRAVTP